MSNKTKSWGFGARLRAARIEAGLSGSELGKGAGENGKDASKASVSDWEHDRHYPKADQLRVICLKLNINVDDLIFGDIKEHLKVIQAESAIKALSPSQRAALIGRMNGPAVSDDRVEQFIEPAPFDELHSDFGALQESGPGSYKKMTPIPPRKHLAAKKRGT